MLHNKCRHSRALPPESCSFCISSCPDSLLDLCSEYITNHLETMCFFDAMINKMKLMEGLALPEEICERLLKVRSNSLSEINSSFINIFNNVKATRLKRVRLRKTKICDDDLEILLKHGLIELDISHSPHLTNTAIKYISEYGCTLLSLSIGENTPVFPKNIYNNFQDGQNQRRFIFLAPKLRKLTLKYLNLQWEFYKFLLINLPYLVHLDLSNCMDLRNFDYTQHLNCLTSLVLYNVDGIDIKVPAICLLTNLRHLDISQSREEQGRFENGNELLSKIVDSLPHLTSLDISGTNLAGRGVAETSQGYYSDIPGLNSRINNPFQFLGLYDTSHDACLRHDIPAKLIAGNANEEQILVAALAYLDRSLMLQKVLNELFHLFRYENCEYVGQALNIVLDAMSRHLHERHIQISGSATLFYIVKCTGKELQDAVKVQRRVITTLLNGMSVHRDDDTMMRNGCLTLCQFKIPSDVLFDYERLVDILLYSVRDMQQGSFVQRIGIYLLNSLACQVDGQQKVKLGELGAINKMIWLISDRLERGLCDDVLEVAWSTMWNVTDETPSNCKKFLESDGMKYFLSCLQKFNDKEELLRNMMGLLGNVAEVKELRYYLITNEYLTVFSDLLNSQCDGIEVSYNAAGVISHIASDGPEVWTVEDPSRQTVLKKMVAAIERWDISSHRNINYRSFEPILYLVKIYDTPECQHWAVWALANLTKVYPEKYCALVEKEGGFTLLQELIEHQAPPLAVKHLANMVLHNCRDYQENPWNELDAFLDG